MILFGFCLRIWTLDFLQNLDYHFEIALEILLLGWITDFVDTYIYMMDAVSGPTLGWLYTHAHYSSCMIFPTGLTNN